ncbi:MULTISPECIES: hypothetical protein [Sediminibacterium]|uniref:hypothetical protein n=1 Tax=Sediminibacterium TaxID=504481 RepID=UPI00041835CE|nr:MULTISPECIES: hypothetical protein [Sediminibacterium]
MNKLILSLAAFSIMLSSCSNSTNEKSNNQTEIAEQNNHHLDDESEAIELNNGEKWKVDANMITHIRNMENDINHFANVEQKDFKSLAEKLQTNIDLLTSNCTMKGKAHDELHKWLLPYIDMVKELSEAKNETEASEQFKNIQTSFSTFNQYFQ